ncbi:hypothetical protein QQX98_003890 [Neonectria punicea]|uniref:argininosuccinate synthase n=1 Tax=Neonectria punicea TaxID=979145 RepID=A0ABR1HBR3_9HYPO
MQLRKVDSGCSESVGCKGELAILILVWLLQQGYQVVCYLGDVGQEEDFAAVEAKALKLGAEAFVCGDLVRELVEETLRAAIACNSSFEERYLLGTALSRPIIARGMVRAAESYNCQFLSHGCTGKGGRNDLLKFAEENNIPVSSSPKVPWIMDDNIIHCSYEAGILKTNETPPESLWTRTLAIDQTPNKPQEFAIHFEKGIITKVVTGDQEVTDSVESFKLLNKIGHDHGIGRVDIVENRFIGLKSRGCYDTPGLTIARLAHIDLEGLVMDGQVCELRDQFVSLSWSRQLYNGMYFSPEREFTEASLWFSQQNVTGVVRLTAYKGNATVLGRYSDASNLYSEEDASMDSLEGFSPMDTTGFIAIQAIRLKKYGEQKIKDGKPLSKQA